MLTDFQLEKIKRWAIKFYTEYDDLHGWPHVERVCFRAIKIAQLESIKSNKKADISIIQAAAWLHDIGRQQEKKNNLEKHHAQIGADLAAPFLKSLGCSTEQISAIIHAIMTHSFSIGGNPRTIEAKALSDADKLDALGAVGFFRACAFQHDHNHGIKGVIAHFDEKLLKLPSLLYSESAKKFGAELLRTLEAIIGCIREEIRSEYGSLSFFDE